MADGLSSLKYGIGNQDVGSEGSTQDLLMFLAESIGPGYGLGEYSEGIQDLLEGNISGIPRAGLGLVAALPLVGKHISKGAQKVVDKGENIIKASLKTKDEKSFLKRLEEIKKTEAAKERSSKMFTGKDPANIPEYTRIYHGTRSTIHKDPIYGKQSVLYVSPDVKTAEQFSGMGLAGIKPERIYPLKIKTNTIKEKIFDPSNEKHLKKLKENSKFKEYVDNELTHGQEYLKDNIRKPIKTFTDWLKEFKKNNYYNNNYSDDGVNVIATTLEESKEIQDILKQLGFEGFTIIEGGLKNIGLFLDKAKGGSKILKSVFEKKQGGLIRDYHKNYNTQRLI